MAQTDFGGIVASNPKKAAAELRKKVAAGKNAGEIAAEMHVGRATVFRWIATLREKLGPKKLGFELSTGRRAETEFGRLVASDPAAARKKLAPFLDDGMTCEEIGAELGASAWVARKWIETLGLSPGVGRGDRGPDRGIRKKGSGRKKDVAKRLMSG